VRDIAELQLSGRLPLLSPHVRPFNKSHHASEVVVGVVIEEELFEEIERAIEAESLRAGQVVLEVRRIHALHVRPADRHLSRLPALRCGHFASGVHKFVIVLRYRPFSTGVVSRNSNDTIGQCASRLLDDPPRLVSPYTALQCPHRFSLFSCCS
jgi:hypothetical protein